MDQKKKHHFLLVSYGTQSHINPALNLTHRLTTTVFTHRLMFPNKPIFPFSDPNDHLLCYHPISDEFDDGVDRTKSSEKEYLSSFKHARRRCLCAIAFAPATGDRPTVTFIVYSFYLPWACEVAGELGLQITRKRKRTEGEEMKTEFRSEIEITSGMKSLGQRFFSEMRVLLSRSKEGKSVILQSRSDFSVVNLDS